VTAVDTGREKRFDVVYHIFPTLNGVSLRATADETTQVPSIIEVFPGPTGSSANATTSTA